MLGAAFQLIRYSWPRVGEALGASTLSELWHLLIRALGHSTWRTRIEVVAAMVAYEGPLTSFLVDAKQLQRYARPPSPCGHRLLLLGPSCTDCLFRGASSIPHRHSSVTRYSLMEGIQRACDDTSHSGVRKVGLELLTWLLSRLGAADAEAIRREFQHQYQASVMQTVQRLTEDPAPAVQGAAYASLASLKAL